MTRLNIWSSRTCLIQFAFFEITMSHTCLYFSSSHLSNISLTSGFVLFVNSKFNFRFSFCQLVGFWWKIRISLSILYHECPQPFVFVEKSLQFHNFSIFSLLSDFFFNFFLFFEGWMKKQSLSGSEGSRGFKGPKISIKNMFVCLSCNDKYRRTSSVSPALQRPNVTFIFPYIIL